MDGSRWSSSKARLTSSISASEKIRQDVTQNYEKITLLFANEKKKNRKNTKITCQAKKCDVRMVISKNCPSGTYLGTKRV